MIAKTLSGSLLLLVGVLAVTPSNQRDDHRGQIQKVRDDRDERLRTRDFSPLKKMASHRIPEKAKITVGSSPDADVTITGSGIAPIHIVLEGASAHPVLHATGGRVYFTWDNRDRTNWTLRSEYGFRMGQYNILYWVNPQNGGRFLQVFDPAAPAVKRFKGLEYFAAHPSFRIESEVIPAETPARVQLLDSTGREQTFWVYGHLRFRLQNAVHHLELYTESLDPERIAKSGFNLMFTDATSGRQTYPAGRYLSLPGVLKGGVTVDFNLAESPPCALNPLYSCPFPRKQNRLAARITAGEKWTPQK